MEDSLLEHQKIQHRFAYPGLTKKSRMLPSVSFPFPSFSVSSSAFECDLASCVEGASEATLLGAPFTLECCTSADFSGSGIVCTVAAPAATESAMINSSNV